MSLTKKKWETFQNEKIFQYIRGVHSILLYNLSEVYSIQHHVINHHDVESGVKQHNPNQTYKPFVDE
jgi:hypothetical protein